MLFTCFKTNMKMLALEFIITSKSRFNKYKVIQYSPLDSVSLKNNFGMVYYQIINKIIIRERKKISTKLLYYINYIQLNINLPLLRS